MSVERIQQHFRENAAVLEQTPDVVTFQLRQYLYRSIPKLSPPSSAQQWTAETERLRKHLLEVIFHGWPKEWVDSEPKSESNNKLDKCLM